MKLRRLMRRSFFLPAIAAMAAAGNIAGRFSRNDIAVTIGLACTTMVALIAFLQTNDRPIRERVFNVGWEPSSRQPAVLAVLVAVGVASSIELATGAPNGHSSFFLLAYTYAVVGTCYVATCRIEFTIGTQKTLALVSLVLVTSVVASRGVHLADALSNGLFFGPLSASMVLRWSEARVLDNARASIERVLWPIACVVIVYVTMQFGLGKLDLVPALSSIVIAGVALRFIRTPSEAQKAWLLQKMAPDGVTWNYDAVTGRMTFVGPSAYALENGYIHENEYAVPAIEGTPGQGPVAELDGSALIRTVVPLINLPT